MSNSPLVSYTKLSPNHSGQRTHAVDRITPHCVVGQCSVETLGNIFAPTSRQASCQYGIGVDGRVGMYVEEKNRSWCSSSNANDQRAITIECASDATHPYAFNDTVYAKLIELCTDICKRYGKTKLLWFGDKTKTLNYEPASNEMVLTVHRWFANKSCPGDWMYARMGDLASKVTAKLGGSAGGTEKPADNQALYRVQTGAFSNKTNADAMLQKVKDAGFDTYMVKVDNLYKIQVGAFSKKANAPGTMNTKGMFWGSNDQTSGVKVFGMENVWGNLWRRTAGWINANGTQKVKLTRGTHDGSTATDYNTDGSGYKTIANATPAGTSGGYISSMKTEAFGRLPVTASGSSSTYEADGMWYNNSQVNYACVGGGWYNGLLVGPFYADLNGAASNSYSSVGAALSCKPLAAA